MKIRQGFVSNSSTSSFVVVTTQKAWDEVVASLSDLGKAVVEHAIQTPTKVKFMGKDLISVVQTISTEDFGCDLPEEFQKEDECGEQALEAFYDFQAKLSKHKDILVLSGD